MSNHTDISVMEHFSPSETRRWGYALAVLLSMVLAVGGAITWWEVRSSEIFMRESTLADARMIAGAISSERVARLAGTEADLTSSDYQRIREQLVAIRAVNPRYRYLYLMGRKLDAPPFFFMGTAPPGAPDYSPPGQVYYEEAPFLARVFETGAPAVSDPVADRWGTWVSALVPMHHPVTGELIAVFGMDIDADRWRNEIFRRSLIPAGLTLFVAMMVIALFAYLRYRHIRQTEENLRKSEEIFRNALALFPQGIAMSGGDGTIDYVNEQFVRMFGYDLDDIPTVDHWFMLAYPDEAIRSDVKARWGEILERIRTPGGKILPLCLTVRCKDGSDKIIEFRQNFFLDRLLVVFSDITDQKRADELLRESEERYRVLVENAQFPVVVTSVPDARVLFLNQQASEFFGIPLGDAIGRHAPDYWVCSEDHERYRRELTECGSVRGHEVELYTAMGKRKWVITSATAIRFDGKSAYFSIFSDITERKRTEDALRESEYRFRTVIENAQAIIFILDKNGIFILSEGKPLAKVGLAAGEVVGLSAFKLYRNYPEVIRSIESALKGESLRTTVEIKGVWMDTFYSPYRDKNGEINGVIGIATDITERKKAEAALRESEDRWRSLVQGFGDVVSIHDAEGKILYITPSSRRTLGYAPEFLTGISPFDYTHPEDLDSLRKAFMSVYDYSNDGAPTLFRFLHAEGRYVYLESLGRNMVDHPGIGGVVIVSRDVTERIRAEAALRESEEQLRQVQKMEVVGQLAGGIAHDFNNMLGGISGYAELLGMKLPRESPLQKNIQAILKGAERASGLTQKLLAFARKGKVVSTSLDIHEVIRAAIGLLERSIDRRIQIVSRFDAASSMVTGDPTLLQNAFLNIGINARDAMPEGGALTFATSNVTLDETFCRTHPYALEPGPFVEIDVIDTGEGIPKDLIPRIFEPFFTTKPVGKGTGLGLSAVFGTVKEHRGGINVYSEPGMGTVFKIYLPVDVSIQDAVRSPDETITRGQGCILVVDDESIIRNMASELLMTLGYDVLIAEDGEAALELYQQEKSSISLVLLDMVMPKISGRETFLRIRAIDPSAKILFSSGFTREGGVGELMALGAAGFVQKPYRLSVLSKAISEAMGRR